MIHIAALSAVAASACAPAPRPRVTPISPARIPFELQPMTYHGRTLSAPAGTEISWSPDGSANALIDGGIGRIYVFSRRVSGPHVTEREIRRLFASSLDRPDGPLMTEHTGPITIHCQKSSPAPRNGPPLRFAACLRLDDQTRHHSIVTLAIFGTLATHFDRLGGTRLCAEILRTANLGSLSPP